MQIDMRVMKSTTKKHKGDVVRLQMWNGKYKKACGVFTLRSLIKNMTIGVTQVSLLRCSHLLTSALVCFDPFFQFF